MSKQQKRIVYASENKREQREQSQNDKRTQRKEKNKKEQDAIKQTELCKKRPIWSFALSPSEVKAEAEADVNRTRK